MLIQIQSAGKDDSRKVTIDSHDGKPVTFSAPTLKDAHKLIKLGRDKGWDEVTKSRKD